MTEKVLSQEEIDALIGDILPGIKQENAKRSTAPQQRSNASPNMKRVPFSQAQDTVFTLAKTGNKSMIGRCPSCNRVWDFPIDAMGNTTRVAAHNISNEMKCSGSGKKPIPITLTKEGGYCAKDYLKDLRYASRIKAMR